MNNVLLDDTHHYTVVEVCHGYALAMLPTYVFPVQDPELSNVFVIHCTKTSIHLGYWIYYFTTIFDVECMQV